MTAVMRPSNEEGRTSQPTPAAADAATRRRAAIRTDRVSLLERMVEIRLIEDKILELFAAGHISGTTHTSQGQEAVAVGIAAAIPRSDIVMCTYRGHGIALALGVTPAAVLGEILGRTIGCMGGLGGSMHLSDPNVGLLPTSAIVGAGLPIAAGAGLAAQVLGNDRIAVAVFGDGAANIGAFHEALNLAAVWQLPVVFVCENNLYGEYTRINLTTPVADLADRAASYAMPGHVVDGQDVDAVRDCVAAAAERARQGDGPAFIEAKTYRYAGHSRSDAATYRPAGELDKWMARDPVALFTRRLVAQGLLAGGQEETIWNRQRALLDQEVEEVLAAPRPTHQQMLSRIVAGGRQQHAS